MTPLAKAQLVKEIATRVGFDRVGVASVSPLDGSGHYRRWLSAGYHADMHYLARNPDARSDPTSLLPGARSAICVALRYQRTTSDPPPIHPTGQVAQYARGKDYHIVLRQLLHKTVTELRQKLPESFDARICVDSAPILERELAQRAGLGWIGRNTCLLDRRLGSFLYLGEVLTTLEIHPDEPVEPHCGRCTRCIDACPTNALRAPGLLDARRCISYQTIENRADVPENLAPDLGHWIFGCDICQQVCPYNRRSPQPLHPALTELEVPRWLDLIDLVQLRSGAYRRLTRHTALNRASRRTLRRNAAVSLGNAPETNPLIDATLAQAAVDDDPLLRQAARDARRRREVSDT